MTKSKKVLLMKYHPAKKEVAFSRKISGKEIKIEGNSRSILTKYINAKGLFVLQDQGSQFFQDILESFDGEKVVNLDVTMTKNDYEDFVQMVDFFNSKSEAKINVNLLAELPDMEATYEVVKNHGLKSIDILKKNMGSFSDIVSDNENVHDCIELYDKEINQAIKGIKDKIDKLEKNSVNICFSGPYSSGKSLLIDSLIGYGILPTDIRPETAAMFMISSPKEGENVRINFNIMDSEKSFSELIWNEQEKIFAFSTGPLESETRKSIQETLYSCKDKAQYEQMHDILSALNSNMYVERVIKVFFPIAIDNERIKFTIYDTPGTDSGVAAHRNILKDALSEQTNSILVFVTYPNGLSGGGNKALLEYLSEIENKENRTTIDLGRSLFVINYADNLNEKEQFDAIVNGKITNKTDVDNLETKDEEDKKKIITIKLSDKKVFFTSAKFAYLSVAKKNGIISKSDEKFLKLHEQAILDEEFGQYFRHDKCASSEYATQLLINKCIQAMEAPKNDLAREIWVASGLFALQNEIQEYGEKFSSAVKAFAIIDGVDKALAKLARNAQSIERQNYADIEAVDIEINAMKEAIESGIANAKKSKVISKYEALPSNVISTLRLDAASITQYVQNPIDEYVNYLIMGKFQRAKKNILDVFDKTYDPTNVPWDSNKEIEIKQMIRDTLSDYTEYFKTERKKLLEKHRDEFVNDVRRSISNNGEISEEAKSYILSIETPEVEEYSDPYEFGVLYNQMKITKEIPLPFKIELDTLRRKDFIQEMNKKLRVITGKLADNYAENYRNSLNDLINKVEIEFSQNMEKYSLSLKAKLEDKEAMEELRQKIINAAQELKKCQDELDSVIWEVKNEELYH